MSKKKIKSVNSDFVIKYLSNYLKLMYLSHQVIAINTLLHATQNVF